MFQRCVETTVEIEIKHFREDHSSKPQWRFAHNTRFWSGQIRQHLGPLRKVFNFLVSYMEKTPPNSKGPSGYEGRRLQRFAKWFFLYKDWPLVFLPVTVRIYLPIQLWYLDYKKTSVGHRRENNLNRPHLFFPVYANNLPTFQSHGRW